MLIEFLAFLENYLLLTSITDVENFYNLLNSINHKFKQIYINTNKNEFQN